MAVLDTEIMAEFSDNLNLFNRSMNGANFEINDLLKRPGIKSDRIDEELSVLKGKLENLSAKWDELSEKIHKELNISIEEANKFQKDIEATLESN